MMPAPIRNRCRNMALSTACVRTTVAAETTPAGVLPFATSNVNLTVDVTRESGTADLASSAASATVTPATDCARPRRMKRPRSRLRPRAWRLLTVPTGKPNCRAASSWVRPSRSQRTTAVR